MVTRMWADAQRDGRPAEYRWRPLNNSKFALRPHHVWKYGIDIQFATNEIRRGKKIELEMLANAQRDGRPAEYRWRPLLNAAKFG